MIKKDRRRKRFQEIGREGVADRILEIAREIVEANSYKRAVAGAGQMRVLAGIAESESYWSEILSRGELPEERYQYEGYSKFYLQPDGHIDWKKLECSSFTEAQGEAAQAEKGE